MQIRQVNYTFSSEKNHKLILERYISFEEVIAAIDAGYLLDIITHPNMEKYAHQKMYAVNINNYVYLVLFVVEKEGSIFLKTIIPSRKAKKKYLKEIKDHEKN